MRGRNGYRQSAVDVSRPMTEGDQEVGDDTEPEDPVEQRLELAAKSRSVASTPTTKPRSPRTTARPPSRVLVVSGSPARR